MKRLVHILICILTAVLLFGCTPSETVVDKENEYAKSISEYFITDELYHNYHGYAEAGFEICFVGRESVGDGEIYSYKGYMNDERGGGNRGFTVTYTIDDDRVIERVENNDYMAVSDRNIYSKIEDMVILSGEIKEGAVWEQSVVFDGEEKTAVTEISAVDDISFTTVTKIDAEGYENGVYTEERTYTKGSGLTAFKNTPYGSDMDDSLIFGYNFSIANESSITGMD